MGAGAVYYSTREPLRSEAISRVIFYNVCHIFSHTVAAAVLSFEKKTKYVAVITAFATAVLTWVEYRSHEQKLILFTTAVHALEGRMMWWHSLRPAEQTSAQFTILVLTSEQIIQDVKPLGKLALHELASGGDEAEGTAAGKATTESEAQASQLKQLREQLATTQRRLHDAEDKAANDKATAL